MTGVRIGRKFDESQAGFRRGYSAVDNMFCSQVSFQERWTFLLFYVDFRKTFDKINLSKLFLSLERKGVFGNFLRVLKSCP